ncbi:MAG: group II intron reverse transcriptase/maturase [Planctomycetota bacterium]
MGSRQLAFTFADSPSGSGSSPESNAFDLEAALLRIVEAMPAPDPITPGLIPTDRLLDRVASLHNLAAALSRVARNKGAPGIDGKSVDEVVLAAYTLLPQLRQALLTGTYQPGDVRRVWIPKPGGGQRGLGIPNVIDRVVQQAILHYLEVIYEPTFHPSSHGFRRCRGAHTAIAEAKTYVEAGYGIVVDIDLAKFFDRVHHQRLLSRLGQRIGDSRLLRLIGQMLKAKVVLPDGTRVSTEEGTPQGGPLSPLLSNIVLDEFDQELKRRGLRFVRYADDCNIFVRSERAGQRVMSAVRRFLEERLRLQVNEEKSKVALPEEIHFLGFTLGTTSSGRVMVQISARTKDRIDTRIRELTPRNWGRSLSSCLDRMNLYLKGWVNYFRIVTKEGAAIFERLDAHIRRRLRAIIVRQKKRPSHLFHHLRRRCATARTAANAAYCQRGPWYKSRTSGLHIAYPNAWFAERLVSLWSTWDRFQPRKPEVLVQRQLFEL